MPSAISPELPPAQLGVPRHCRATPPPVPGGCRVSAARRRGTRRATDDERESAVTHRHQRNPNAVSVSSKNGEY